MKEIKFIVLVFFFSTSVLSGSCLKQLDESSVNSSVPFALWRNARVCLTCDGHGQTVSVLKRV